MSRSSGAELSEAFDVETFSGTARRQNQKLLASEAACHKEWIHASMDIDKAFLKGLTYEELAEATGEATRTVCFTLLPIDFPSMFQKRDYTHPTDDSFGPSTARSVCLCCVSNISREKDRLCVHAREAQPRDEGDAARLECLAEHV